MTLISEHINLFRTERKIFDRSRIIMKIVETERERERESEEDANDN